MTAPDWDKWHFLLGEWTGEGGGEPGQGQGSQVFHLDLQGQVLLRKNHVDFPAIPERPAFSHDDLTVVYPTPAGDMCAIYFDNEGHVTTYTVKTEPGAIVMVSDPEPNAPRFRTTLLEGKSGTLVNRFEIAPPADPDAFEVYVEGTSIRK